jgi:hypothetical protein
VRDWEARMSERATTRRQPAATSKATPEDDYEARPEVPPEVLQPYIDAELDDVTPEQARAWLDYPDKIACACVGPPRELWQYKRPPCYCVLARMAMEQRAASS